MIFIHFSDSVTFPLAPPANLVGQLEICVRKKNTLEIVSLVSFRWFKLCACLVEFEVDQFLKINIHRMLAQVAV